MKVGAQHAAPLRVNQDSAGEYKMFQTALALIQNEAREYLLVKHAYDSRWYSAPGGGVEAGESPQTAVIRELREELGVEIAVRFLVGIYEVDWGSSTTLVYLFDCEIISGELRINQPEEIESFAWFTPEQMPQHVNPLGKYLIEDVMNEARGVTRSIKIEP
jgi:8-oxo-dGTP diphosphatase